MQKKKWIYISSLFFLLFIIFLGCQKSNQKSNINTGFWRMEMNLGEALLPFNFEIKKENDKYQMLIFNADEVIEVTDIVQKSDSIYIRLPVYETEFQLKINNPNKISGVWKNYYRGEDYKINVEATYGESFRFFEFENPYAKLFNKFEVSFQPEKNSTFPAIGLFEQEKDKIKGTFITETGDFRHLEGQIKKDSLFLSSFDGSVAYLFKATFQGDSIHGSFWSGNHYQAHWKGKRNDNFELRNPDSLTQLKKEYNKLQFSFPNVKGKHISLDDSIFKNKVVIVQIMGSWCHNCLDETEFLTSLYQEYNKDGLEVVALAFERTKSKAQAFKNIERLIAKTQAPYPFLLAAWDRKTKAVEKLPMLNHIMSFPTTIFIDKSGEVAKIHTGFYGPSSGKLYEDYVQNTTALIHKLLAN